MMWKNSEGIGTLKTWERAIETFGKLENVGCACTIYLFLFIIIFMCIKNNKQKKNVFTRLLLNNNILLFFFLELQIIYKIIIVNF